jgi:hypothetical protein
MRDEYSKCTKLNVFKKNVIFSWNGEDCIAAHSPEYCIFLSILTCNYLSFSPLSINRCIVYIDLRFLIITLNFSLEKYLLDVFCCIALLFSLLNEIFIRWFIVTRYNIM